MVSSDFTNHSCDGASSTRISQHENVNNVQKHHCPFSRYLGAHSSTLRLTETQISPLWRLVPRRSCCTLFLTAAGASSRRQIQSVKRGHDHQRSSLSRPHPSNEPTSSHGACCSSSMGTCNRSETRIPVIESYSFIKGKQGHSPGRSRCSRPLASRLRGCPAGGTTARFPDQISFAGSRWPYLRCERRLNVVSLLEKH